MPGVKDTGNGAAVSFATLTFASHVKSISAVDLSGNPVDITHLGSTWEESIPGDIKRISEMTVDYYFDSSVAAIAINTVDTCTVTLPEATATGNPATLVGTGFVTKSRILPALANEQANMGQFVWKFDGGANSGTVPAYTPETNV
jgi:hypothetical protein